MTDEMLERVCIMRDKWVRVYLRLCMCMADVECRDWAMDTCIQGHGSRDAMTLSLRFTAQPWLSIRGLDGELSRVSECCISMASGVALARCGAGTAVTLHRNPTLVA